MAHPGAKKTLQLVAPRYYWKGMNSFIAQVVNKCCKFWPSHINHDKTPNFFTLFSSTELFMAACTYEI